jgi:large subunit ribosomal protein L15
VNILDVNNCAKAHKRRKRVGRGDASGMGKTSGRGHKGLGQKSSKSMAKFEGGQMQIFRRIPKRGFNNSNFRKSYTPVNLTALERLFEAGATVEPSSIKEKGIAKDISSVKILGNGELTKSLTVKANAFSKAAVEKIEKAGGKAEVI